MLLRFKLAAFAQQHLNVFQMFAVEINVLIHAHQIQIRFLTIHVLAKQILIANPNIVQIAFAYLVVEELLH